MVESMHPNEAFASDYIAKGHGAFAPATEVINASKAAHQVAFPQTQITLDDVIGHKAMEHMLGQLDVLDVRIKASDRLYQGITTSACIW